MAGYPLAIYFCHDTSYIRFSGTHCIHDISICNIPEVCSLKGVILNSEPVTLLLWYCNNKEVTANNKHCFLPYDIIACGTEQQNIYQAPHRFVNEAKTITTAVERTVKLLPLLWIPSSTCARVQLWNAFTDTFTAGVCIFNETINVLFCGHVWFAWINDNCSSVQIISAGLRTPCTQNRSGLTQYLTLTLRNHPYS